MKKGVGNIICKSEREIFEVLEVPYKEPHERNCQNFDISDEEIADDSNIDNNDINIDD